MERRQVTKFQTALKPEEVVYFAKKENWISLSPVFGQKGIQLHLGYLKGLVKFLVKNLTQKLTRKEILSLGIFNKSWRSSIGRAAHS